MKGLLGGFFILLIAFSPWIISWAIMKFRHPRRPE